MFYDILLCNLLEGPTGFHISWSFYLFNMHVHWHHLLSYPGHVLAAAEHRQNVFHLYCNGLKETCFMYVLNIHTEKGAM